MRMEIGPKAEAQVAQSRDSFYNNRSNRTLKICSRQKVDARCPLARIKEAHEVEQDWPSFHGLVVSVAMGLGMTACGGGTIGFMWVLGTQYNQIAGFKIDDFTGNLTTAPHSPFTSGGSNPVSLVVKPGGRYLYVINKGAALRPAHRALCLAAPTAESASSALVERLC